jgi:dihydroorotase
MALLAGVADNTIDIITSDHNPIDIEHKKMEFDGAKNGSIGLESAFGALLTVLPVETIVAKLTYAKSIFSIESSEIAEGKPANVTLFSTDGEWIFTKDAILSKSKNSAFLGTKMKGKVIGIYNNNTFIES